MYTKKVYVNGTTPAINATNLNSSEQGIYDAQLYGADAGGDDTYVVNLSASTLFAGMTIRLLVTTANTGACTLSIDNGTTTKNIKKITPGGIVDPIDNDIPASSIVTLAYDGTQWLIQSVVPSKILIYRNTLASPAAAVSITSIPTVYSYLRLRIEGVASSTTGRHLNMTFNSDTGSNYTWAYQSQGTFSTQTNQTAASLLYALTDSTYSQSFVEITIANRAAGEYKSFRGKGYIQDPNHKIYDIGGRWQDTTNLISSITLTASGDNIGATSKISLWGEL